MAMGFHVTGTFTGTAHASYTAIPIPPPRPIEFYDGATVTGSFSLDVVNPYFQVGGDNYAYFFNGPGSSMTMSFDIKGVRFDYSSDMSVILLDNGPVSNPSDTVMVATDFHPKFQGASFQWMAAPGSLFDPFDPNTLRLDGAGPIGFDAYFANADAKIAVNVDVAPGGWTFDTTSPVPEVSSAAMLLAGMAVLLLWRVAVRR
jgi:hypothetical protein